PNINFIFNIIIPNLLMALILLWGIADVIQNGMSSFSQLVLVVMPILLLSSIVGVSNPSKVKIDDESISFYLFGRRHSYQWEAIDSLKLRRYDPIGKIYIGIGTKRIFGGRYWISSNISNYAELNNVLYDKYQFIHSKEIGQEKMTTE